MADGTVLNVTDEIIMLTLSKQMDSLMVVSNVCIKLAISGWLYRGLRWCHPLKIVPVCENCFCHNLKTNKVKYTKVYISRKGI